MDHTKNLYFISFLRQKLKISFCKKSSPEADHSTAAGNKTPQSSIASIQAPTATIKESIVHIDNLKLHEQSQLSNQSNSPSSIRIFKKFSGSSQKSLDKKKLKEIQNANISTGNNSQSALNNNTKSKDDSKAKTFKRTIIKKKLPPRLYLKAKQHLEAEKLGKEINVMDRFQIIERPKREVVLVKDENYGFGFIAGSEKPLVIRFVSQGKN